MTRIARRQHLITLQYPTNGPRNVVGHKGKIWNTYGDAWVSLRQTTSGEVEVGGQLQNFANYECRMLFVDAPTLTTHWRLRQGSSEPYTYYNIAQADQNEFDRKEWILQVVRDEREQQGAEVIDP